VGDMTKALNFTKPDYSVPALPSTVAALSGVITQCEANLAGFTAYQLPSPQTMPVQEPGSPVRPSGAC
jgi:phospholipase C